MQNLKIQEDGKNKSDIVVVGVGVVAVVLLVLVGYDFEGP